MSLHYLLRQKAISVLEDACRNVIKPKWDRVKLYSNKREAIKELLENQTKQVFSIMQSQLRVFFC